MKKRATDLIELENDPAVLLGDTVSRPGTYLVVAMMVLLSASCTSYMAPQLSKVVGISQCLREHLPFGEQPTAKGACSRSEETTL